MTDLDSGLLSPVRAGTPIEPVTGDLAWLQAMLDAETALARAQARMGLVPPAAAETITKTGRAGEFDLRALAEAARGAANPVVGVVQALTAAVADADPAAADYVHRGSTSQDVLDTATMLVAARALQVITADLERTADALAVLAAEHRDTPAAGRTLTQHAVPTTFGLKAAGWLQGVLDALERLRALQRGGLPVELGGAAGTLAGYLEYARIDAPDGAAGDPARYVAELFGAYADELGLAVPVAPWHTARTPLADLAAALTLTSGVLGKIAVDVQSLSRTEVAEVSEPSAPGRGVSSAMPQKVNPVLATLIRSAAAQVPLLAVGVAQALLAEDERPAGAWHAEWQPLRECLRLVGGAAHTAAELTAGLRVDADRMAHNLRLTGALIVAERLAAVLAPVLGKAAAKAVVTRACLESAASGRPLGELLSREPEIAARFTRAELDSFADPARYTGAAGALVDRVLARHRELVPAR
ncbi:3-carboxy-cis,cis-muconate cycloisomerase [Streptomyces sp. ISL-43]|uniref:3-carboxy-cis,cis-muconate cycloisomerase n=1 Tax=Streptomyces sp. ISL-43 TaxID=2819183 RepID=UPI001BE99803|nr:3-carboxy-cis,cis-muconate cycloisomerase [Streptomyces sp. ISL-43]MBT2446402.1 3-carboxy-cis,cis-muconate cycloisomerase [Streptomyces sp. ISL-43]